MPVSWLFAHILVQFEAILCILYSRSSVHICRYLQKHQTLRARLHCFIGRSFPSNSIGPIHDKNVRACRTVVLDKEPRKWLLFSELLDGIIEQFALYYAPGLACLAIDSVLAAAMVTILYTRVHREKKRDPTIKWHPLEEAIKQILPLVAYPVLFLLLLLPGFVNRVYGATPNQPSVGLMYFSIVCTALWGFVGGATLSVHILIMSYSQRAKLRPNAAISYGTAEVGSTVVISSRPATCTSGTYFVLPSESDIDGSK